MDPLESFVHPNVFMHPLEKSINLVVIKKGVFIRVEVTTAYTDYKGDLKHVTKDPAKFDTLALVEWDGSITYIPPFPDYDCQVSKSYPWTIDPNNEDHS